MDVHSLKRMVLIGTDPYPYERCGKLVLSQNDLQMLGLLRIHHLCPTHSLHRDVHAVANAKGKGIGPSQVATLLDTSGQGLKLKKNMVQFEGIFNGWDNMWSIRGEYWFIVVHWWFFMFVGVYLWLCLIIYGSYWVQLGTITPSSWGPYNCGILYPLITRSCLTPFWRNESIYIILVWLMSGSCLLVAWAFPWETVGNNLFWSTSCSQVHI